MLGVVCYMLQSTPALICCYLGDTFTQNLLFRLISQTKMVKPRERKTNRGQIPQEVYEAAANKVINEHLSVRAAARQYEMCHVSLNRFVKAKKENGNPVVGYRPHNKVFSTEQEQQLGQYVQSAAKLYFGLSPKELRKLAFQFARSNNCNYPENWNNLELASEDWLTAFLKRNPNM